MGNIVKYVMRGLAIGMLVVVAVYMGSCVFVNVVQPKLNKPSIPDATTAPWVFTLKNTGEQTLAAAYTMQGQAYVLNGYWQRTKNGGYRYVKAVLKLDPKYFGPISLGKREATTNAQ